jgi:acyl carrier protein
VRYFVLAAVAAPAAFGARSPARASLEVPRVSSSGLTKDQVLSELRATMKSEFDIPPEQVQLETRLVEDLDLDSIDLVDLAVTIEESTGLKLREEELESVRTMQDAVDVIHARLAGVSPGAT